MKWMNDVWEDISEILDGADPKELIKEFVGVFTVFTMGLAIVALICAVF